MHDDERRLLGNLLDAFDRLFDEQANVMDVEALIFATAMALRESPRGQTMLLVSSALREILRAGASQPTDVQRTRALEATDSLRLDLSVIL